MTVWVYLPHFSVIVIVLCKGVPKSVIAYTLTEKFPPVYWDSSTWIYPSPLIDKKFSSPPSSGLPSVLRIENVAGHPDGLVFVKSSLGFVVLKRVSTPFLIASNVYRFSVSISHSPY